MAMIRCPICGERFSDTYRECPFCEEEEALHDGEEIRRSPKGGKRTAQHSRQYNLITPVLVVLIVLMSASLVYLLRDTPTAPSQEDGDHYTEQQGGSNGVMPEVNTGADTNGDTQDPDAADEPDGEELDFEAALALPDGLSLSTTDFTLDTVGETASIRASGGSSTYTWMSEDPGIASVDEQGKVTAVSKGTVQVIATDGSKKGVCIVRVKADGGTTTTTPDASAGGTQSGSLRTGAAVVVNGGNGVRVRSGPGTSYEILASIPNGSPVQVVENAGDDWYKITYSGVNGVTASGYMKGEFLANS